MIMVKNTEVLRKIAVEKPQFYRNSARQTTVSTLLESKYKAVQQFSL